MSDTIPDITAPLNDWVDVYDETSITVGTELVVTNKSTYPILLYINASEPAATVTDGEVLDSSGIYSRLTIDAGESGLWARSLGIDEASFSVQEG